MLHHQPARLQSQTMYRRSQTLHLILETDRLVHNSDLLSHLELLERLLYCSERSSQIVQLEGQSRSIRRCRCRRVTLCDQCSRSRRSWRKVAQTSSHRRQVAREALVALLE